MPVTEVEREARDAGLLGPDSPISQNKSFRSARDILGIVPQRKGGAGAKGQWVWELPVTPKMPSKPYDAPFIKEGTLEPIQEEWIHEQRVGLVSRLSMRRIIARRTKAATVLA
jgi:hypothetical protein